MENKPIEIIEFDVVLPNIVDTIIKADKIKLELYNKDSDNKWYGSLYSIGALYQSTIFPLVGVDTLSEVLTLTRPNSQDSSGNFLVSYERYLSEQYGGSSFSDRALNKYLTVVTVPKSAFANPKTVTCYGGDTYI